MPEESLKAAEPVATYFLERIDAKTLFSICFHLLSDSFSSFQFLHIPCSPHLAMLSGRLL